MSARGHLGPASHGEAVRRAEENAPAQQYEHREHCDGDERCELAADGVCGAIANKEFGLLRDGDLEELLAPLLTAPPTIPSN